MKIIFIISLAIVLLAAFAYPSSKEPTIYLGHAEYDNKTQSWCVVRVILAKDLKQADSLFTKLVDSLKKKDGCLWPRQYDVWKVEPENVLKINHDDINRSY